MSNDVDHPSHVRPLAAKVEALAGFGISAGDIARVLGLDEDELRLHFSSEVDCGAIKANARVDESLFRKATAAASEAPPWADRKNAPRAEVEPISPPVSVTYNVA